MLYQPKPIDTSDIDLPDELLDLKELLAKNTHKVWSKARMNEGWRYAKERNDSSKTTPCLVPYDKLPESEKEYDRILAVNVLKLIIKLGYDIQKAKLKVPENGFIVISKAAKKWGVSEHTVRAWIARGKLPQAKKMGRDWLIPADIPRPPDRRYVENPIRNRRKNK